MMVSAIWLCVATLALGSPGHAQHPLVVEKLNQWNDAAPQPSSQKLVEAILPAAKKAYANEPSCLTAEVKIVSVSPATAERYVFQSLARNSVRNGWHVAVNHPRCDSVNVRYLVVQSLDQSLSAVRVNRGISHAHDSLIADTLPLVTLAAEAMLKQAGTACNASTASIKLGAFRIDREELDLGPDQFGVRYAGSWSEIWPMGMCGQTVEVPVRFTADGDGGAGYRIQGTRAKIIPGMPK